MNLGLELEDVRKEVLNTLPVPIDESPSETGDEKVDLLAEKPPKRDYKRMATAFRQIAHQLVVIAEELEKPE